MRRVKDFVKKFIPQSFLHFIWYARYFYWSRTSKYIEKVNSVTVEVTNVCDIHCTVCSVPKMRRAKGFLTLPDFKIIFSKLPATVKNLRMNFSGEPLLNKEIFQMVKHAKTLRPEVDIRISTNGTHLANFPPEEIIGSGLDELDICLDGPNKEIHEEYRRGSDFDKIVAAAKQLCEYKSRSGAASPKIIQMTLLNKKTSPFIPQIIALAKETGFDELQFRYMSIPTLTCPLPMLRKISTYYNSMTDEEIGSFADRYLAKDEHSLYKKTAGAYTVKNEVKKCFSFISPAIFFNGDVSVCCHDGEGAAVFGNLLKEDFVAVLKKMPAAKVYDKKLDICRFCDLSWMGMNSMIHKLK